LWSHLWG